MSFLSGKCLRDDECMAAVCDVADVAVEGLCAALLFPYSVGVLYSVLPATLMSTSTK